MALYNRCDVGYQWVQQTRHARYNQRMLLCETGLPLYEISIT